MTRRLHGNCHCGSIRVMMECSTSHEKLQVRACQCGFCRPRGVRTISDPEGRAIVRASHPGALNRYRFGLRLADYLLCAACGTYIAAIQPDEAPIGVVNVGGLGVPEFEGRSPDPVDYGGETGDDRLARRRSYWMPIEIAYPATAGSRPASGAP